MFEYTALVDAPTQRFTGIVTGSDPDDEPSAPRLPESFAAPAAPTPDAPMGVTIKTPEDLVDPGAPGPAPAAVVRLTPPRRTSAAPEPAARVALAPALIAIAAAGVTAMWWLRRDSHDR